MATTKLHAVVAAWALCWGVSLHAQTPAAAPVLKMNQVTEQALVDALAIDEPGAEEGAKTRSIRPTARSNNNTSSPSRVAAGKSNLLITFTTNSADLTSESKQALGTVAKAMQSDKLAPFAFSIEGHADPRGSAELNQKLSAARAQSVASYLVSAHGIAADRLSPVGKGSFALAGRRSYIDLLLPAFVPDDAGLDLTIAPRYYDYQALFDYPLAGGMFTVRVFGSDDRTKVVTADPNEVDTDTRNQFETAQFFHRFDVAYEKQSGPWRFLVTPSYRLEYIQFGIGQFFDFDLRTHNVSMRAEVERKLGRRSGFRVGTEYVGTWFDIAVEAPPIPTGPGGSGTGDVTTQVKSAVAVPAVYSTVTLGLTDKLTLFPGVRMGYYTRPDPSSFVDPRMNFAWQVADRTTIKGGTGLYTQAPQPVQYSEEFGNPRLAVQRGYQNSLGVSQQFEYGIGLDATAFFNYIWDQAAGSSDIVVRPDGDVGPEIFANTQRGRTYGLEVLLRKQLTGRFFGWLAYTLSRSERKPTPDDEWQLFDFDQTHILTLIGVVKLPKGWQVGGRFRLVSGNPNTPVVGAVYDAGGGFYQSLSGKTNSERIPMFQQLDVRVDKRWTWKRTSLTLYVDVQNVLNHQNTEFWIYSYDFSGRRPVTGLPIIPSLGIKLEF